MSTLIRVSVMPRPRSTPAQKLARRLLRSYVGLLGLVLTGAMLLVAVFAPLLAPYDPVHQNLAKALSPPSWQEGSGSVHIMGTDYLGRDVLSRVLYGTRISFLVGFVAVAVQGCVGTLLGLVAGYYRGRVDELTMLLADVQLALPFLVLALATVAVLGTSLKNVILVLGIVGWVSYGRIVRGEVFSIREREFIFAARVTGATGLRILLRHVLPNVTSSIIVVATLQVARMIVAEASLSFLGLGVQPPTPSLGRMVAEGRDYITTAWWVATFPGLAIFLTVLGINLFGDWLRDFLDPTARVL
jgi:peptide/nickel transport system permease protein